MQYFSKGNRKLKQKTMNAGHGVNNSLRKINSNKGEDEGFQLLRN